MNPIYQPSPQQIKQKELLFKICNLAEQNNIEIFITGGYGLDALYGALTRDHRDFDIYLYSKDEKMFVKLLEKIGFYPTKQLIGEVKKREYKSPEFVDGFSIEYALIEEGMKLSGMTNITGYIPTEPTGTLDGKPIRTFRLKGFKKMIDFNNQPTAKHTEAYRHQKWLDGLLPKLENKFESASNL